MPILVACESCHTQFSAPDSMSGKRGKCPKCGSALSIGQATRQNALPPSLASPSIPAPRATPNPLSPQPSAQQKKDPLARSFTIKISIANVLMVVVSLLIGYFIGREHVRAQLQRNPQDTASSNLQSAVAAEPTKPQAQRTETQPVEAPETAGPVAAAPTESASTESPQFVDFEQSFVGKGFEVSVAEAKIERPSVTDILGDKVRTNFKALTIKLKVTNTNDRKILQYRGGNLFSAGHFSLHDDVDNEIRDVSSVAASLPFGDLTSSEDIAPGATMTHVEIFSLPPPKTKFLVLTMNLEALGADGSAKFNIPVERIAGFTPSP